MRKLGLDHVRAHNAEACSCGEGGMQDCDPRRKESERIFSVAGNIMSKKQARLTCDYLEAHLPAQGLAGDEGVAGHRESSLGVDKY